MVVHSRNHFVLAKGNIMSKGKVSASPRNHHQKITLLLSAPNIVGFAHIWSLKNSFIPKRTTPLLQIVFLKTFQYSAVDTLFWGKDPVCWQWLAELCIDVFYAV